MNRHTGLEWAEVRQGWKLILENSGLSMRWKEPAANRMSSVMIRDRRSSSTIVRQKVPGAAKCVL